MSNVADTEGGQFPNEFLGLSLDNSGDSGFPENLLQAPLRVNSELATGGVGGGTVIHSGTGTPQGHVAADVGEIYIRTDTPLTSNQRIYICSVAGVTPGGATWVGIV